MKRLVLTALFIGCMATPAFADLDAFLSSLNVQARADMNGLALKVGAQFGVPLAPAAGEVPRLSNSERREEHRDLEMGGRGESR